ncbi:uncharacterized protein LOC144142752 isoform X2 [Haemaphysalis longicornis]
MPVAHRAQSSWRRGDSGDGQSFFVVPVPSPLPTGPLGQANTHEGLTDFLHASLPVPVRRNPGPRARSPPVYASRQPPSRTGAVIEPFRMPFESSCPWMCLSLNR